MPNRIYIVDKTGDYYQKKEKNDGRVFCVFVDNLKKARRFDSLEQASKMLQTLPGRIGCFIREYTYES